MDQQEPILFLWVLRYNATYEKESKVSTSKLDMQVMRKVTRIHVLGKWQKPQSQKIQKKDIDLFKYKLNVLQSQLYISKLSVSILTSSKMKK